MADQLSATPRVVILSGHPTDTEVAAITAALTRHRAAVSAERHAPAGRAGTASPWIRAARLEASGHAPVHDRAELTR
jgi:hypothetical protein